MPRYEKSSLHNSAHILVLALLFVTLLAPVCYTEVSDDIHRIKRGLSKNSNGHTREVRNANSARGGSNNDFVGSTASLKRNKNQVGESVGTVERFGVLSSDEESDYVAEAEREPKARRERDARADLKYTDQDEKSSLYDDYEAKDIAKRGVLGGPEDYEEVEEYAEEDSRANEAEKARTRGDVRIKRDSETNSEARLEKSKIAEDPHSRQVSDVESPKNIDESCGGVSEIEEPARAVVSYSKDTADPYAEYEKRAEQQIQRKIDLIKDEIQRDIDARQRIRQIRENNAKFDELQQENEERGNEEENESRSGKRDSVAKRSISETVASSKKNVKKRSPKSQQRRSVKTATDKLKKTKKPGRKEKNRKHEPVKEMIRSRKRRSRGSFASAKVSSANRDVGSHLRAADRMAASPLTSGHENTEEKESLAEHPDDSLASLTGSSPELRLAKDYREAFGGLQSEPGSSLARFKRIKRVLSNPDDEKMSKP